MKKIILLFGLLTSLLAANAQTGDNCLDAIPFVNTKSCITNNSINPFVSSSKYFSFVADSTSIRIELFNTTGSSLNNIDALVLYLSPCDSLTVIDHVNYVGGPDTSLVLNEYNLVVGNTYYLVATKKFRNIKDGPISLPVFDICLTSIPNLQNGVDCFKAIPFANTNSCLDNNTLSETEMWFSFVADSTSEIITQIKDPASVNFIKRMEFYSGNCSNLSLMDTAEITLPFDSVLTLFETNLIIGNTYYIRTVKSETINGIVDFNLCLRSVFWQTACPTCAPEAISQACDFVCNGNFEYYTALPTQQGQAWSTPGASYDPIAGICGWQNGSYLGSSDYFNQLATNPAVQVSANVNGNQASRSSGNAKAYAGIDAWDNETNYAPTIYHEYISQKLISPLQAGHTYRATMWVSLAEKSDRATDFGMYFSSSSTYPLAVSGCSFIPTPIASQLIVKPAALLTDETNWIKITGLITPTTPLQWLTIGGFSNGFINVSTSTTVSGTGAYYYVDEVSVIEEDPAFTVTTALPICEGQSATLTASGAVSYQWFPDGSQTTATITVSPTTTTTYTVIGTDIYGCSRELYTTVIVHPKPVCPASMHICPFPSANYVNLYAYGAGIGANYTWTPGPLPNNSNVTPTTTTTYTVTESLFGCTNTETVIVYPLPTITTSGSTSICSGGSTILTASGVGTSFYYWSPGTGLSCTSCVSPVASPAVTTTYTVEGTNAVGCPNTTTLTVTVDNPPIFQIIANTTTPCTAADYTVSPILAGVTYSWVTSAGYSGTGSTATQANTNLFPAGGTITFTGTTSSGCTYTTSLNVSSCCIPATSPLNFINSNTSAMASIGVYSGSTLIVTNQTFAINGTFTVNQSLTLKGCDLRMGYLAKININPGMTLTITSAGTDLTHIYACNEMWDGIYVSNPNSLVRIDNGTTIEDAFNAVVSTNRGNYQIEGNTKDKIIFNKNYKSLVVTNATGTHPGYIRGAIIQCYDGVPNGNPANTAGLLHYPHTTERSVIGVEISDVNNVTIGDYSNNFFLNKFDNLDFGIVSNNSSVNVYNNDFTKITSTGPPPTKGLECLPGTAICARGAKAIIKTLNVGSSTAIPGYRNTFTNGFKGIVATQNMNVNVWHNSFDNLTGSGIRVSKNTINTLVLNENTINNTYLGIDCFDNKTSNITIDNNDINPNSMANAQGITASEVIPGALYTITRNTILNVRKGIAATGLKAAKINSNNVTITHTTSSSQPCYGIGLTNSSQCNIIGNWVQGQNSSDYWVNGIFVDLSTSDYVTCNESHTVGTGMFFGGTQTPNTYIAKNLMDNNYRGLMINYGIVGPQGAVGAPNDNKWTGAFTYHTFSNNSFCNSFPFYVRSAFGQYHPSPYLFFTTYPLQQVPLIGTSGNLNSLHCPIIFSPTGNNWWHKSMILKIAGDSIVPAVYDASTRLMLKQSLYNYLKTDSSLVATEPLVAQFKNYNATHNVGKLDNIEQVLSLPSTYTSGSLTTAQMLNNSITPSSDVETNSQWINDVFINNALTGSDYSDGQLSDLRILAAKCPYNDGPAVYQARAILSQIETIEYINPCESEFSTNHSMLITQQASEDKSEIFKLYPNPNDGSMNFIYSLNEASKGELSIYDISGRLITKYFLQPGENNQVVLNETKLNSGIYFYKVIIDNQLRVSDKIVIIK